MPASLTDLYDARVAQGKLRPDAGQRAVLPVLERLRAALEDAPAPRRGFFGLGRARPAPTVGGLYLWGGVGRGKSMLMDLFCAAVMVPKRRVHFHEFMQEIQGELHRMRQEGAQDALRPVAEAVAAQVRLLCLDEMQITDIADAMIVGRLFEILHAAGCTVVTTSNRVPEDLYRNGLNRQLFLPFIAFLRRTMEVHEIASATDYRQNRLAGAQVYFTGAGRESAMDRLWAELSGGGEGALVLPVNGRQLRLARFHAGVARASFWDLCGRPLGPADYLAIAGAVRVLMIDDIPHLSAANFNEAKRFVTLIDTLYEARVRVIASAADSPEHLYNEGTGSFEFERTASRLREMQGAQWGADRGPDQGA